MKRTGEVKAPAGCISKEKREEVKTPFQTQRNMNLQAHPILLLLRHGRPKEQKDGRLLDPSHATWERRLAPSHSELEHYLCNSRESAGNKGRGYRRRANAKIHPREGKVVFLGPSLVNSSEGMASRYSRRARETTRPEKKQNFRRRRKLS